ncbi:MAG: hypothetical protein AAF798_21900 [Bacteroidota bacterium]
MMYSLRTWLLLLACCSTLIPAYTQHAQLEYLKKHPNVTWMASFEGQYSFNPTEAGPDRTILTKFYQDPSTPIEPNLRNYILVKLFLEAMEGNLPCYKDAELTQLLPVEQLRAMAIRTDTITTINPQTYESNTQVVQLEWNPADVHSLATHSVIYYDRSTTNYHTKVLAVSLLGLDNLGGNSVPAFWIKIDDTFPKKFSMHDANITWGGIVMTTQLTNLRTDYLKELKNTDNHELTQRLYEQALMSDKRVESSAGYGQGEWLDKLAVLETYRPVVDTIITYDPLTYEEMVHVRTDNIEPQSISEIRLVQEWYYDDKRKTLFQRLRALAPMVEVKDKGGSYVYKRPLHYIRYD